MSAQIINQHFAVALKEMSDSAMGLVVSKLSSKYGFNAEEAARFLDLDSLPKAPKAPKASKAPKAPKVSKEMASQAPEPEPKSVSDTESDAEPENATVNDECPGCETGCDYEGAHRDDTGKYHPACSTKAAEKEAKKAEKEAAKKAEKEAEKEAKKAAKKATKKAEKEANEGKKAKRAPSGYNLFCKAHRDETKDRLTEDDLLGQAPKPSEVLTEMARMWKMAQPEVRNEWNDNAKASSSDEE